MNIIFRIIVGILKLFSLPYQMTKRLLTRQKQDEDDARKLLDILKKKE